MKMDLKIWKTMNKDQGKPFLIVLCFYSGLHWKETDEVVEYKRNNVKSVKILSVFFFISPHHDSNADVKTLMYSYDVSAYANVYLTTISLKDQKWDSLQFPLPSCGKATHFQVSTFPLRLRNHKFTGEPGREQTLIMTWCTGTLS